MTRNLITSEQKFKAAMEYFDSTPSPDQSLCPEMMQYFTCSRGYMVYNNKTGERTINNDLADYHIRYRTRNLAPVRPYYHGLYVKYVQELNALELSEIELKGNRGLEGVKRDWYWASKYTRNLIFHDDVNCYRWGSIIRGNKYYCKDLIKYIRNINLPLISSEAYDEFQKFNYGHKMSLRYGETDWPYPWHYAEWYQNSFMPRNTSKKASDILSYAFDPIEVNGSDFQSAVHAAVFQSVDDDYAVLRVIRDGDAFYDWRTRTCQHTRPAGIEILRIFVDKKGKPTTVAYECGSWRIKANLGYTAHNSLRIVNVNDAMTWAPLKYIIPALGDNPNVTDLLAIMRHPIVEQCIKAGYPNIGKRLAGDGMVGSNLKELFGVEKEKKLPIYKLLGVNKYILREYEQMAYSDHTKWDIIREMKKLYGRFDLCDLDETTVKLVFNGFLSSRYSQLRNWVMATTTYWSRNNFEVTDNDRKAILKLFRMATDDEDVMRLWEDTLRTYKRIDNKPDVDVYRFHNINDLRRMHDDFVALQAVEELERQARYNEQRQKELEAYRKSFDKLQEERLEKFEYETDADDFVIRIPHELSEITTEGAVLHHCVGGYVHSHASGETNIIFLRRKDEPTRPFYTIEIKHDTVIQIHGMNNRWLGNNPEAVPFMYRYLKQLGVRFDEKMLLNRGAGYSMGSQSLPESALLSA